MQDARKVSASVPFSQRGGGSPAGEAIRRLLQEDAESKNAASARFQDQVKDHNAQVTQPYPDEQTPSSLLQQAQSPQPQQSVTPPQQQPQQQQMGVAPAMPPAQPSAPNPSEGPANPGEGPQPLPDEEEGPLGGSRFGKGRRYI